MTNEIQLLVLRDNARNDLMEIKTIEAGMNYMSKLKLLETWVKAEKKDAELSNLVSEQKLRTQRTLGQLIKSGQESGEVASQDSFKGNQHKVVTDSGEGTTPKTIPELGLTHKQSMNFQHIAAIPEDEFESFIQSKKEAVNAAVSELTTAGILRIAKKFTGDKTPASLERQVSAYLNFYTYKLFVADCNARMESESKRAGKILKDHYLALPELEKQALTRVYDEIQEEQHAQMIERAKRGEFTIKI